MAQDPNLISSWPGPEEMAQTPTPTREPRRDEFGFLVTTPEGDEYSIAAQLEDGETKEVAIHDSRGGTVILPSGVIEQLISAVGTQEQLLRAQFARGRTRMYGADQMSTFTGGLQGMPMQRPY